MKSLKLTSAKITSYALEKYLSERFPSLSELQVTLDRTLGVSAVARGRKLEAEFILALTAPDVIEIRPVVFSLGPVSVSEYLLKLFSFRMDFSGNPYGFSISGLRIRGQMLEFY